MIISHSYLETVAKLNTTRNDGQFFGFKNQVSEGSERFRLRQEGVEFGLCSFCPSASLNFFFPSSAHVLLLTFKGTVWNVRVACVLGFCDGLQDPGWWPGEGRSCGCSAVSLALHTIPATQQDSILYVPVEWN